MKVSRRVPTRVSNQELRRLLAKHVKDLTIDEKKIRKHVIRPENIVNVFSDRGPQESQLQFTPTRPIVGAVAHHLDVGAFGAALHDKLKGNVAGYTVQLRQHGQAVFTADWQWAKRPQDGTESWTPDVQLHVASVSKLITAIAMTLLMSEKNISPDAQIIDYLPDYWVKGPNIQYIVFRNLMNHTSGLTGPNDLQDFHEMKAAIAAGISLDPNAADHLGKYHYQNMNFGLCRILLAVMNGNISRSANFTPLSNDTIWDMVTVAGYAQYTTNKVFRPAGVFGATLDHPDSAGLAYRFPVDSTSWNSGSLESMSATAGWHLSVDQVLNVMGEFRRGRSILTPEAARQMLDNGFGVDPFVIPPPDIPIPPGLLTPAGELYCKNGRWHDDPPSPQTSYHEEQSLAYFLPEDMELVVLVNSPVGSPEEFFRDVVTQVYLNNLTTRLTIHP
jgi:hypothetical protein